MQTNTFVQLIILVILVLSDGNCMPMYSNGLERYGPEPYYQKDVDCRSSISKNVNSISFKDPKQSSYRDDEYYSMRGHDRRPSNLYAKGSVPFENSKHSLYCSDTLHHYINDCVGALNKLKKYKNKNAVKDPYYDIKTHEEREIEYEVLTQKFIEILHKLVMLKTADEHVYDTKKPQNFYIKSPLTTTTTSLPPINPIDPYYNRVPVYYYPPYHAPYLYNQDYSFNELDFELPSENKQYKLKKRKGKNLEQKTQNTGTDFLKDHFSPSAYKTIVEPGDIVPQPVQVSIIDEPLLFHKLNKLRNSEILKEQNLDFQDNSRYSQNLVAIRNQLKNRYNLFSGEKNIESTTLPFTEYLSNDIINDKLPNRTTNKMIEFTTIRNMIRITDMENNDIHESDQKVCSSCPLYKPYHYMGKPMFEDTFTNSH